MAVCPHCQQTDKNFFAQRCHNCNQYTRLGEQILISSVYVIGKGLTIVLFCWMIYAILT